MCKRSGCPSWENLPKQPPGVWLMTKNRLLSQMTRFNAYLSLLIITVDIPYQQVIVYVCSSFWSLWKNCILLSVPMCNGHPPSYTNHHVVCHIPESGSEHSLKKVSNNIVWYRLHTWGLQGKCHKLFSVLFCVYLQII